MVAMWGAPPTVGYLLVRHGATDKIMLHVHVELKRRSFQLSATMLSGVPENCCQPNIDALQTSFVGC